MTTLPSAGYISDDARVQGEVKVALEAFLQGTKELLGGTVESTLTIATGTVTPTGACHALDTEGGAASDDLTTIAQTNHPDGRLLLLRIANAARVVTVKHAAGGAGQISLAGGADRILRTVVDWLLLKRTGTLWEELPLGSSTPTGAIILWAVDLPAPPGYLALDGSAVSRTAYPALWLHYGTRHGAGDGLTTFNLPRMIGRIPIALDLSQTAFNTTGKTGGAVSHTLTEAEIPPLNFTTPPVADSLGGPYNFISGTTVDFRAQTTNTRGGGQAHSIMNPFFVVQFCVKT